MCCARFRNVTALNIDFHPGAEDDFISAIEWYKWRASKSIANRFIQSALEALENITDSPYIFPNEKGEIRKCIMRRFPYKILFEVQQERILILAIAHVKRHPNYWQKRSKF